VTKSSAKDRSPGRRQVLARGFAPLCRIRRRPVGVAFEVGVDLGDDQPVGAGQRSA